MCSEQYEQLVTDGYLKERQDATPRQTVEDMNLLYHSLGKIHNNAHLRVLTAAVKKPILTACYRYTD